MTATRVAVTGARGRLGRALMAALGEGLPAAAGVEPARRMTGIAWTRPEVDLDDPESLAWLVDRDGPSAVGHAAAGTAVDGCARQPAVALRRNGSATEALARACARHAIPLVLISTNEVFDGLRPGVAGYGPDDEPAPGNPYGASKLAGEVGASAAYAGSDAPLAIVRTAWLYGPPGRDFPDRILDAAGRALEAGEALRLVADEIGNPTYAPDLAAAIVAILRAGEGGRFHVVNEGAVSRAGWARSVIEGAGLAVETEDVPASTWARASTPPPRAVLQPTPIPGLPPLRSWAAATAEYLPELLAIRARREAEAAAVPAAAATPSPT